jgi:endonuclease G
MKVNYFRLGSSALLLALVASCAPLGQQTAPAPNGSTNTYATATRDDNLAMGNPSGAVADATNSPNNYLLTKTQYTMSYSRDQGKPNWVSWHLSTAWLGSAARQDNFAADASLPSSWYHVGATSYLGSGFDRGHNCPSADRTGSVADNSATFLMSNMMPQAPTNNQQTWANLENYCRTLASAGNELYIVAGSYGKGGTGTNGYYTTIDGGHITVPSNCWKVIVVLPVGTSDVSRVSTSTRVIAVNMPNTNSLSTSWGSYRTSVDAIESATGYNLLSAVSSTIQSSIESKTDTGATN